MKFLLVTGAFLLAVPVFCYTPQSTLLLSNGCIIRINEVGSGCPVTVSDVVLKESCYWPLGLEATITNRSYRPLYYVSGAILFPESRNPCSPCLEELILHVSWGREIYSDWFQLAQDTDECLLPGQTARLSLSLHPQLEAFLTRAGTVAEISLTYANYGDGCIWFVMGGNVPGPTRSACE